jgi:hypothetical protein
MRRILRAAFFIGAAIIWGGLALAMMDNGLYFLAIVPIVFMVASLMGIPDPD